jgi:hypothetical protein
MLASSLGRVASRRGEYALLPCSESMTVSSSLVMSSLRDSSTEDRALPVEPTDTN